MNQVYLPLSCIPSAPNCDGTGRALDNGWITTAIVILVIVAVVAIVIKLQRR